MRALLLAVASLSCGGTRDIVPETHDVRAGAVTQPDGGGGPNGAPGEGYVYIAKRPLGAVALAEARGMSDEIASRAVDHLADALDTCATDLGRRGKLVDGAARVVVMIGNDGTVAGLNVKLSPGSAVAANAILCLITPLKLTTFPVVQADAGARGMAIESTWGPRSVAGGS